MKISRPRWVIKAYVCVLLIALVCVGCSRVGAHNAPVEPPALTGSISTSETYEPYVSTDPASDPSAASSVGQLRTPDGKTRTYRLYVPAGLLGAPQVPLLVALHGGLGTSEQFEANSGFDGLAEANRFVVVYPDGVGARPDGTGPQTWNGGYCCGRAARDNIDDVGFIRQLIERLETDLSIDAARVYVSGHSNGAIMA